MMISPSNNLSTDIPMWEDSVSPSRAERDETAITMFVRKTATSSSVAYFARRFLESMNEQQSHGDQIAY